MRLRSRCHLISGEQGPERSARQIESPVGPVLPGLCLVCRALSRTEVAGIARNALLPLLFGRASLHSNILAMAHCGDAQSLRERYK